VDNLIFVSGFAVGKLFFLKKMKLNRIYCRLRYWWKKRPTFVFYFHL